MEHRHLGKAEPRKEALKIITGTAIYTNDYTLPGMLYAKYLKSPYPHANIISIDVTKAKALTGVKAVMTYKDVDPTWVPSGPAGHEHRKALDSRLHFVGDAVALVAAVSEAIAEEAVKLIEVEYEVLPAVYTSEEAFAEGAPIIYEQFPGNHMPTNFPRWDKAGPFTKLVRGDAKKGLEESDMIIEGEASYDCCTVTLAPETPVVIVAWDDEAAAKVWASTAGPGHISRAHSHKVGGKKLDCIAMQVGGSYGTKNNLTMPVTWAAMLSKATKQPVKVNMTKLEHMTQYDCRLSINIKAKVGMKKDGVLHAFEGIMTTDTGAASITTQGQMHVALGEAQLIAAKCQNWHMDSDIAVTNHIPGGTNKGYGGQELKSALIPLLMKGARSIDMDPVEYYLINMVAPGDEYIWRDGLKYVCHGSLDYTPAIRETAKAFGWSEKWKGWGKPYKVEGTKLTSVGVGVHMNADAGETRAEAHVRVESLPRLVVQCMIPRAGQAQDLSAAKLVAEVFDVPLDFVEVAPCDSSVNPFNYGLVGSRGTMTVGSAVSRAALDAKRLLFEEFSKQYGDEVESLHTKDGLIWSDAQPERKISWGTFLTNYGTVTGKGVYKEDFDRPNFFILFCEVEIDLETGKIEITNLTGGSDVGQIIDPVQLRMQFHGGIGAAGIDAGLYEEHILDRRSGKLLTSNLIDYKWRPFNDFMPYQDVVLESQFDVSPSKAIGVGEITGAPGPAAIMMAVCNAIGTDINKYPITPDKVLKALGKA